MISHSSHPPASTLRERMIEDMSVRGFGEKTRNDYIRNVRAFGPHVTTLPSPVLNDTATGQIPIVDAPPAPPARGFLPRRLSDAGPPTSAPSADHARPASETLHDSRRCLGPSSERRCYRRHEARHFVPYLRVWL